MKHTRAIAVTAALLLFAAGAAVFGYLKYRRITAYIAGQLGGQASKTLGRGIRLSGVSFSPLKGIVISDLCVSRRPDFSKGEFFCASRAVIRPELASLLRSRVRFSRVAFEKPVIKVREKGGRWDFEDLVALLPETDKGLYLTWNASELELTDAAVEADMETSGLSFSLENASLKLEHYSSLGGNYGLQAEGRLAGAVGGKLLSAEVSLEADANFDYGGLSSTDGSFRAEEASYGEITLGSLAADWKLFNMRKPLADRNYSASLSAKDLLVPANGNRVREAVSGGLKLFASAMGRPAPRIGDIEMGSLDAAFSLNDSVLAVKDVSLRTNFLDLDGGLSIDGPARTAQASLKAALGPNRLELSASGPLASPEVRPLLSSTLSAGFKSALRGAEQALLRIFPVTGDK